jgi:acetyl esterase/lipase
MAASAALAENRDMNAPLSSWVFLGLTLLGLAMTVTGLVRATRLGWGNMFWFLCGWLTSELALFHVALSALVTLGFAQWSDAFDFAPGRAGLAIVGLTWLGLIVLQWRARPARRILWQSLRDGLGAGHAEAIPAARRAVLRDAIPARELLLPFNVRDHRVERLRDIPYGDGHARQVLDLYRPADGCANAPVLLQIHGGGWVLGNKNEQALPLVYHLAARGWIVVTPNYRLSPQARFPDHLVDCKRAFAWIRSNVARFGGDPSFIAVTGGSAGGHLAALMGLTANDPRLQPGFESTDTTAAACVPFYGVYDFTDRHGLKGSGAAMVLWLEKTVMPCSPGTDPTLWDLASPIEQVRPDAPPFFILHGDFDSLASVAEARLFAERLRSISRQPVLYAELPGAQHAWEVFRSVRAMHSVHAVTRFLEWARAARK